MPNGVSGFELAQDARRLRQDLKIVMMSGYVRDPQSRSGALADVVFLAKPFRQTDLAAAIASALGVPQTESTRAEFRRWSSAAAAGRGN